MNTIQFLLEKFLAIHAVSTDTRNIVPNALFFALKGENFNGNAYAEQALEKGASLAVVDEEKYALNKENYVLVDNVLHTLQQLANAYRRTLTQTKVIGLTGSNGKTTCKELFKSVAATHYKTSATVGNLNNHIGVPLTLLNAPQDTEVLIVEMGANHQGEIDQLCKISEPDCGYITNFGNAHLEGFGGPEGVVKGKSELYNYLRNTGKEALVFADDKKQMANSTGIKKLTFAFTNKHADLHCTEINAEQACIQVDGVEIKSNLTGQFHNINIAAAVSLGTYLKISAVDCKVAIANYMPKMNRSEWRKTMHNEILLDAYNANPDSMRAAITMFAALSKQNKWFVLGDMFELGEYAAKAHQEIIDLLHQVHAKNVVLIGEHFCFAENSIYYAFKTTQDAHLFLKQQRLRNVTVLLKGSRGMQLETLTDVL